MSDSGLDHVSEMIVPFRKPTGGKHSPRSPKHISLESSFPPRDHPLPVPNGWYCVAESETLGPGDILSFKAVDRELVAYRDEDGMAHLFDAHCPHLGAHLGGGEVLGDRLKCPYHGWAFAPGGQCVEVPYCDSRIPAKAKVRTYELDEKDGLIYFWYHAGDKPPNFRLPSVPQVGDAEWTRPYPFKQDMVASLQEMGENNVDYAHLRYVHRRPTVPHDASQFFTDGPKSWVVEKLPEGSEFTRYSHGPGFAMLQVPGLMTMLTTTTPIDRGTCRLLWHFFFPVDMEASAEQIMDGVTGEFGIQADVPIWRDKIYRERPVLVKGDGPVLEFRRWYSQFYEGA